MRLIWATLSVVVLSLGCDVEDYHAYDDLEFRSDVCDDEDAFCTLVCNSDIGDTYQYSDDYDHDGFEDDADNCPFICNISQSDRDGDGFGDMCDTAPVVPN